MGKTEIIFSEIRDNIRYKRAQQWKRSDLKKRANNRNNHFFKVSVQEKKCSALLIIKEMQIKTKVKYLTLARGLKSEDKKYSEC